jgi:hypothetical protein
MIEAKLNRLIMQPENKVLVEELDKIYFQSADFNGNIDEKNRIKMFKLTLSLDPKIEDSIEFLNVEKFMQINYDQQTLKA